MTTMEMSTSTTIRVPASPASTTSPPPPTTTTTTKSTTTTTESPPTTTTTKSATTTKSTTTATSPRITVRMSERKRGVLVAQALKRRATFTTKRSTAMQN